VSKLEILTHRPIFHPDGEGAVSHPPIDRPRAVARSLSVNGATHPEPALSSPGAQGDASSLAP